VLAQRFQKHSSGLTTPKAFGVAEVEKPQPGGAGCGDPFLIPSDYVKRPWFLRFGVCHKRRYND